MRFYTRLARRARKNHTVTPSTSLSGGTAPNRGFHSIELLCFAVGGWMTLGEDPCTDLPVNSWIPDRRLADALASGKDNQQK
jgi:hypothetical protein